MGLSFDHIILLPQIYPQKYIYIYAKKTKTIYIFIYNSKKI